MITKNNNIQSHTVMQDQQAHGYHSLSVQK